MEFRALIKGAGATLAGLWASLPMAVQILVVLQLLDIVSGLVAAYTSKTLSSEASFRGIAKKVAVLAVVAGAHVIARGFSFDVPLGTIAAGWYCVHEMLSLAENAGRAGVPLPPQVVAALEKLQK